MRMRSLLQIQVGPRGPAAGRSVCSSFANCWSIPATLSRSLRPEYAGAIIRPMSYAAVVFVEGESDRIALQTLADRLGRDLVDEGVAIVSVGGASGLGEALTKLRADGFDGRIAGMCDEGEVADYRRGLERAGLGVGLSRADMEAVGFFVCVVDLEDELIRALGTGIVEEVIADEGELSAFRTLQRQPAWRDEPLDAQLKRFIATRAGRKARYGRLLVEALDLDNAPRPLAGVLAAI